MHAAMPRAIAGWLCPVPLSPTRSRAPHGHRSRECPRLIQKACQKPFVKLSDPLCILPRVKFFSDLSNPIEHPIRSQLHPDIERFTEQAAGFFYLPGKDIALSQIREDECPSFASS